MRFEEKLTSNLTLDEEHRNWVHKALSDAGTLFTAEMLATLVTDIEASMTTYKQDLIPPPSLSQNRAVVRTLLKMIEQLDPPIGHIRRFIQNLHPDLLAELDDRATRLAVRVINRELPSGGVKAWSQTAPREELLSFLEAIIVQGGVKVLGRQRAGTKRSGMKMQPIILGSAEGACSPLRRPLSLASHMVLNGQSTLVANGRPPRDDLLTLIGYLAADWFKATGKIPQTGCSEASPFGSLVHHVFQWLDLPSPSGALRRYCKEVDLEKLQRDLERAQHRAVARGLSPTD